MVNKYGILFLFRLVFVIRSRKNCRGYSDPMFFLWNYILFLKIFSFVFFFCHILQEIFCGRRCCCLFSAHTQFLMITDKKKLLLLQKTLYFYYVSVFGFISYLLDVKFFLLLFLLLHLLPVFIFPSDLVCLSVCVWVSAHTNTHTR